METYKLTVLLSALFVHCFRTEARNIQGQLRYKRQGGLLSGFTSIGGDFSVSSGLETIADGVRGILSTTKDTVEKLTQQSFGFNNPQIGQNYEYNQAQPEYRPVNVNHPQIGQSVDYDDGNTRPVYNRGSPEPNNGQFGHFNANRNVQPEYNSDNLNHNNANSRLTTDTYPNYEYPHQNRDDRFNGAQTNNRRNDQQYNQRNDGVITYIDNNFPVILLKENEIRR